MGLLLNSTDFTGEYAIPQNQYTSITLEEYIVSTERMYLQKLLGVSLSDLFIADLTDGEPVSPRFVAIFEPLSYDYQNWIVTSNGIKEMLKGFIYFNYTRMQKYQNGIEGASQKMGSNSMPAKYDSTWLVSMHNISIDTYRAIQDYIQQNKIDYPEYNGQPIGYAMAW
jgi:hypothetical protein